MPDADVIRETRDLDIGPWCVAMYHGTPLPVQLVGGIDRTRVDDVGKPWTMSEAAAECFARNKAQKDEWTLKREEAFAALQKANRALSLINSW